MGNPPDLKVHLLPTTQEKDPQAAVLYLSSITDGSRINELFLKPLLNHYTEQGKWQDPAELMFIDDSPLYGTSVKKDISSIALELYSAKCVLVASKRKEAIAADVSLWNDRSVNSPETEHSLTGPKDSFVENLDINISMIRRRIRHEDLHIESLTIGTKSRTTVNLIYMNNLVNRAALEQLKQRLDAVEMDVLLDSSQLGQILTNTRKSINPFPLFQTTERPDKVVAAVMEGRILLLADTSPTGILIPTTVTALYQTTDDYYFPALSGSFIRLVRLTGLFVTLFLPGLYVSISSINYDVFRIEFMLAVAASREGVPYPAYIEVLIMITLLELINEATVRLPKVIGGTATIVGGLIIGTAAAESHLVSNIMIVITGAVAIGSYTVANYMIGVAWRVSSYTLMVLAIPFGLNGMAIGSAFILFYLCHIKSMGVPYLSPLSTLQLRELFRDALLRVPLAMNPFRPAVYSPAAKGTRRAKLRKSEDLL